MKCFVLYHSKYGQTEKIARRIGDVLQSKQISVDIIDSSNAQVSIDLTPYDLVLIGAPIYAGRHSKRVAKFVHNNLAQLSKTTNGFFSVSLSAFGDQSQRKDATLCMKNFLRKTGWVPTTKQIFAGELAYRKYSWFTRWLMKRIMRKTGGDIDTSQDYEYTDWDQVDQFAVKLFELASDKANRDADAAVETEVR
jgi:menaquinone-dependent protoporphyrinogen oxidase